MQSFLQVGSELDDQEPLGTLGDYTLRRQIGRGGMGVVYDAWENSMDRQVALMVLPSAVPADTKAVTRFVREAQLAGKLNHPSVVSVYGMGLKEQIPYYAMEFVEGETLAQILARLRAAERKEEEKITALQSISQLFRKSNQRVVTAESEAEEGAEVAAKKKPFGVDDDNQAYFFLLANAFAGVAEGLQHAHSKKSG